MPYGPRSLVIVSGTTTRRVQLPSSGRLRIGRDAAADVRLSDTAASRFHAELQLGPQVEVRDLGSRNGTWVAGQRVEARASARLGCGEPLRVGTTVLVVQPGHHAPMFEAMGPGRGARAAMRKVWQQCRDAASTGLNVVLVGETGTGKATLARMIHQCSGLAATGLCMVDGAAIEGPSLQTVLGSGRDGRRLDGGATLLLRQPGSLPFDAQRRLAAWLDGRPHGSRRRVLATSREHPAALVAAGALRKDLRFRIEQLVIEVPPLRERTTEIPQLARDALQAACAQQSIDLLPQISDALLQQMQEHPWPGNLRELRNRVGQALMAWSGGELRPEHMELGREITETLPGSSERQRIVEALRECAGNQSQAAKRLGISRRTLVSRLDRYSIPRPRKRAG